MSPRDPIRLPADPERPSASSGALGDRRFGRISRSLSAKLILVLLVAGVAIFSLLGYLNIRLHRKNLEQATLQSAERMGDVIKRSTEYHMLRNDNVALYAQIRTMGAEPGILRIRIFNQEGRISFSTDEKELNKYVDKRAEACYACHAQAQPLTRLDRPDRFRIFRPNGERVLGVITPIENKPTCSNADCHAHPASQKILGVLDTDLSLARADAQIAQDTRLMAGYTLFGVAVIVVLTGLFVWKFVHAPVKVLKAGTERLGKGQLGYQISVDSQDELGELAESFNDMSRQLREAHQEITSWAHTLEERVDEKTRELKRANDHALQVEKMASIGKLAAIVAHEINNPLAGILTYSKLLRKWASHTPWKEERRQEVCSALELIETESRRCGEIVKNLLTFSRSAPMNLEWAALNPIVDRCLRLVRHQLELGNITLNADLAPDLPNVQCDAAQLEQLVLALVMNAIDAMPRGGNLLVRTRSLPQSRQVEVQVRDDGVGIPPDLLPRLFEPFLTTKETGKGVGLGLAISKTIVERHGGVIEVESQPGRGTTFYIFLPVEAGAKGTMSEAKTGKAVASS